MAVYCSARSEGIPGPKHRGAVIIPAYNEEPVIARTVGPLSSAADQGFFKLLVVCNGCTDNTASVARSFPGVEVLELEKGSKPAALNAGDQAAHLWPRIYLDADIQVTSETILAVLDRLNSPGVRVARPRAVYDTGSSTHAVRAYYRVRRRLYGDQPVMWGCGIYGLNKIAHDKFERFPNVIGDDLFIDTIFDAGEKFVVLETEPVVVIVPATVKDLLPVLRRSYRGELEVRSGGGSRSSAFRTVRLALKGVDSPKSAADTLLFLTLSVARRINWKKRANVWEQDRSSR